MNAYTASSPSMADVLAAVNGNPRIPPKKRLDITSAFSFLAASTNTHLEDITATVPSLRDALAKIEPIASGLKPKTLSNYRTLILDALAVSGYGLDIIRTGWKPKERTLEWDALWQRLPNRRFRILISRALHYCCREGVAPAQFDDGVLGRLMRHLNQTSLRVNQHRIHRETASAWNEIAACFPELHLRSVTVPADRVRRTRVAMMGFAATFQQDWKLFAEWAHGEDVFADEARPRRLSKSSLQVMHRRVHLAASTLVQSGVTIESIQSLADLVTVEHFKRILRRRLEAVNGQANYENHFVALALIQLARDWVKVDEHTLLELKRLHKRLPRVIFQMTKKNKLLVTKFDDPVLCHRFLDAPDQIWADVLENRSCSRLLMAEAQAALAISILMTMPMRLGNLTSLKFDENIFLRDAGPSLLILSADETKTGTALEFDIPTDLASKLTEYREVIAPRVMKTRPTHLFGNPDGSIKHFGTVRYLVQRYLKRYVGIHMNPHAYRHLAAKFLLDDCPGAHVLVKDLLGHRKVETTAAFYAGFDTKRAGRHHQALIEKARAKSRIDTATTRKNSR